MSLELIDYEEATEVKVYSIKRICPLDSGEMLPTGMCILVYPKSYKHECNTCSHNDNFQEIYPKIRYEEL